MNFKNFFKTIFIAFVTVGIISCSDDDDTTDIPAPELTIAEIVSGNDAYSTLLAALQRTELDGVLNDEGDFTVFAPDNDAFASFLGDGVTVADVEVEALKQILLNHVLGQSVTSSELSTGYVNNLAVESTSEKNLSTYINISNGVVINNVSQVVQADVLASNGVIHFVNNVIPLPTVVTFAAADANLSTLVAALTRDDVTDQNYVSTLSTAAGTTPTPFTVFAPTNDAFGALLMELGASSLTDIDTETLVATLNLHVIAGANVRAEDLVDGNVSTLGGEITINAANAEILDSNNRKIQISVTNIQAANGVVHVIDKVILPELSKPNTIAAIVASDPNFSLLLAAVQKAGLESELSGTKKLTVFAPDNQAFENFLAGTSLDDVPVKTLTQLLLNHVFEGELPSNSLTTGYVSNLAVESNTNANYSSYISVESGVTINGVSSVSTPDIMASNGIIHKVDSVIDLPSLLTFVAADSSLSSLATAATTTPGFSTDFGAVLSSPNSELTLLAPVNNAFISLGDLPGVASELEQTLLNHVIAGRLISSDLTTGYGNTLATFDNTSNNLSIYINTENGVKFNGMSAVSNPNIIASNGVIHKVDAVITLPTIVTFATADATFSSLVGALTTATPSTDYVSILSSPNSADVAPFTVFAPINNAFSNNVSLPTDENQIAGILNYHVVAGANVRSTDLVDGPVKTLNGAVMIDASAPSVAGGNNPSPSNIIAVDVQAANGIIHAIDQVLLPESNL